MLPGSLEQLTILCADERIIPHLQRVAEVRAQQFPNLKKVVIVFWQEAIERNVDLQMEGVELTVLYQSKTELPMSIIERCFHG